MGNGALQEMVTTGQKMANVIVRVEADQVAIQHAAQQLRPHRQNPVDLTTGKRGVKEKPNADVVLALGREFLAKHLREQHQMIIMHPDQISIVCLAGDYLRKLEIGLLVGRPGCFVKDNLPGMVMQQGP